MHPHTLPRRLTVAHGGSRWRSPVAGKEELSTAKLGAAFVVMVGSGLTTLTELNFSFSGFVASVRRALHTHTHKPL